MMIPAASASAQSPNSSCHSTCKERDAETGLDFFGARYFSGAEGRFTTPDWSAKPQPVPYADFAKPQSLNLYSYLRNNPLNETDPDGHCGLDVNCWKQFGSGFADTSYRPIVQAISHPINTLGSLGNAALHPVDTTVALKKAVVDTSQAALSGDPNAIGKVTGTVVSALATWGAGKAVSTLAKGGELAEAGTAVSSGAKVFRVFGGEATPFGNPAGGSFTTVSPGMVSDFRTAAGLYPGNTGQFVLEGTVTDTMGVTVRGSLPGPGGVGGGLPEAVIPDASNKIKVIRVSGANPEF